jgi:AhpD family alkylhydroperoxidase
MRESDEFFERFGDLDGSAYEDGAVDRKHKELMGLAVSVASRCEECVLYRVDGARDAGATRAWKL